MSVIQIKSFSHLHTSPIFSLFFDSNRTFITKRAKNNISEVKMSINPYEGSISSPSMMGSHYSNYVSGISGYVPSEMIQNGWQFHDHSKREKTIWQFLKTHKNGRYDEIRFDNHKDYEEKAHYHIKKMLDKEEKPTREEFIREIAPQINRNLRILKREKKERDNNGRTPNASGIAFSYRIKMMTICSHCELITEVTPSKTCSNCGKSLK